MVIRHENVHILFNFIPDLTNIFTITIGGCLHLRDEMVMYEITRVNESKQKKPACTLTNVRLGQNLLIVFGHTDSYKLRWF